MQKLACLAVLALTSACGKAAPSPEPAAAPAPAAAPEAVAPPSAASPTVALPVAASVTAAKTVELNAVGTHFSATWHFVAPKVGELFAADITLTDPAGKPVPNPKLTIDVTMPAHGHGMMTDPDVKQVAPTRWHAEGLKLHMHGTWQFDVRIEAADVKERVSAVYDEPPEATDGL